MSEKHTFDNRPIYVFATVVNAPEGRDFAFAEDREQRPIFLHASRARKIENRESDKLWLSDAPETEPARRYAKVYVQAVRGDKGWRALRWGYVPRERENLRDPKLYKKMWYEEFGGCLRGYAGGMLHVRHLRDRNLQTRGEIASVQLDPANDRIVITLRWNATSRGLEGWKNSPNWVKVVQPLADTLGRFMNYGRFRIQDAASQEELVLYPVSEAEYAHPKREHVRGLTLNPQA